MKRLGLKMKRKLNSDDVPEAVPEEKEKPSEVTKPTFSSFGLDARLLQAVTKEKFSVPTPVQTKAIPLALGGQDVLGINVRDFRFRGPKLTNYSSTSKDRLGKNPRVSSSDLTYYPLSKSRIERLSQIFQANDSTNTGPHERAGGSGLRHHEDIDIVLRRCHPIRELNEEGRIGCYTGQVGMDP